MTQLDPITLQVLIGGLRAACEEMGAVLIRSAYSANIKERKHEAVASVRLVNKDGDVIWSTTQESLGAKFKGSSADVADRITRQLVADYERARKLRSADPNPLPR